MKVRTQTTKATKQAHPYRVDVSGLPWPVQIKDVSKQPYGWGNVAGLALVVDLFSWRDVLTEQQVSTEVAGFVQSIMNEASEKLAQPYGENKEDHRGVAVGVLHGLAELVAYALENKEVRAYMAAHLKTTIQCQEEIDAAQTADDKAKALNIHSIVDAKGGPRHE